MIAATIVVAGCGRAPNQTRSATAGTPDVLAHLTANEWTLKGASSTPAIRSSAPVTIRFTADHTVSGAGPCNAYHGSFRLHDVDGITIGPLAQTLRACAPADMTAEHAYLVALERVTTVKNSSRDTLELTGSSHTHLVYAARAATEP
jgi:heat shock protein HslJ